MKPQIRLHVHSKAVGGDITPNRKAAVTCTERVEAQTAQTDRHRESALLTHPARNLLFMTDTKIHKYTHRNDNPSIH